MEALGIAPKSVNPFRASVYVCIWPVYLDWVPRPARVPMVQPLFLFSSFHPKAGGRLIPSCGSDQSPHGWRIKRRSKFVA